VIMGAQVVERKAKLNPYVQFGICVGGIYTSFLVWAIVSLIAFESILTVADTLLIRLDSARNDVSLRTASSQLKVPEF